ncbi:MAG: cation:proton antiporter [Hydrogenophilaceae bacterium]|nr:cation:proton antiporter [Hydrogenophilaceae bacterium]
MHNTLEFVLIMLAAAVLVAILARTFRLPTMLGYLLTGIIIGPYALGWIPDTPQTRYLAEFGVVFLMFSVGLEFSLPRMVAMRSIVFGFGGAQVGVTLIATLGLAWLLGLNFSAGIALGGVLAMSSTAIVSKLLSDRVELQSPHGRLSMGALLFQDLAVVPLLIVIPALAMPAQSLVQELFWALLKAAVVLSVILYFGQKLMRSWFHHVAGTKSPELFTLNLLFITLGLAFLTERAGLSLALGAFLAGMLVSETEYRYQVEDDIKPFRDVLLGLFFITVGMRLDLSVVWQQILQVMIMLGVIVIGKGVAIWALCRGFRHSQATSIRTALALAQGGEFGLVLLALAADRGLMDLESAQPVLAALVISMLLAPLLIHRMEWITGKLAGSEWANKAKEVHDVALKTFGKTGHVIVCGYGRSGQSLARLLETENIPFVALDFDPERVKLAAAAGESVVFGDPAKREVLVAAGISRARAMIITFSDLNATMSILRHAHDIKPELPVVVRTMDDSHIDKLKEAGATEVVSEVMEGSLMLASHALMLLGIPLSQVLKRIRSVRESRYALMRGFFRGATDTDGDLDEASQPRLLSVLMTPQSSAKGKSLGELGLEALLVEVIAVRRRGIRGVNPGPETIIEEGDVLVMRGTAENLAAAEIRLLQG